MHTRRPATHDTSNYMTKYKHLAALTTSHTAKIHASTLRSKATRTPIITSDPNSPPICTIRYSKINIIQFNISSSHDNAATRH